MSNNPELNEYLRRVLEGLQQQNQGAVRPAPAAGEVERIRALLAAHHSALAPPSSLGHSLLNTPSLGGVDSLTLRLLMDRLTALEANAVLAQRQPGILSPRIPTGFMGPPQVSTGILGQPQQQAQNLAMGQSQPLSLPNANQPPLISAQFMNAGAVPVASAAATASAADTQQVSEENPLMMKEWSVDQLEAHVRHLQETSQPIPPSVAILLASARRRENKYKAKKLANRKSAYASRQRKKAKINAMTMDNAKLRRESAILYSLPDPVIALDHEGDITFINDATLEMLQYESEALLGSSIDTIIAPESIEEVWKMISMVSGVKRPSDDETGKEGEESEAEMKEASTEGGTFQSNESDPNLVSLRSSERDEPPVKEQAVKELHSDKKADKEDSLPPEEQMKHDEKIRHQQLQAPSDSKQTSVSGALSLLDFSSGKKRKSPDSSVFGFMESNDSSQDNEKPSSAAVSVEDSHKNKKGVIRRTHNNISHAPACIACLVRNNLSSIWSELTVSLRSRPIFDESAALSSRKKYKQKLESSEPDFKDIIICIRPIREDSSSTYSNNGKTEGKKADS